MEEEAEELDDGEGSIGLGSDAGEWWWCIRGLYGLQLDCGVLGLNLGLSGGSLGLDAMILGLNTSL